MRCWFSETKYERWGLTHPFSVFQQAISAVSDTSEPPVRLDPTYGEVLTISIVDADCYELNTGCYAVYGYEYKPGFVDDKAVRTSFPHLWSRVVDPEAVNHWLI